MDLFAKLQPVFIIAAALTGLLLGMWTPLSSISSVWMERFLMILLYLLFLSVELKQVRRAFTNLRFTLSAVLLNFVWTPLLGFWLGKLFFPDAPDIRIGLLMLLVTPCTDWYLVFTGLSHGNLELSLSILPLNLILQIILLPVYLMILIDSTVTMDVPSLLRSVVTVLAIPLTLSVITKAVAKNRWAYRDFLSSHGDHLQLLFLCLAVVVMFASEGGSLLEHPLLLAQMFLPLLLFFTVLFFTAQLVGRLLHFPKKDIVSLNLTTLARNSPLSLAIAVATFSSQPLVSLALVVGPLIELPVLSVVSAILKRWNTE